MNFRTHSTSVSTALPGASKEQPDECETAVARSFSCPAFCLICVSASFLPFFKGVPGPRAFLAFFSTTVDTSSVSHLPFVPSCSPFSPLSGSVRLRCLDNGFNGFSFALLRHELRPLALLRLAAFERLRLRRHTSRLNHSRLLPWRRRGVVLLEGA